MKQALKIVGGAAFGGFCLLCLVGGWAMAPTTYVPAGQLSSQH